MNRRRGALWLLVIGISWVLGGCATTQTEAQHYVLTQDSVTQLTADTVSDPDHPPAIDLRVACEASEDGERKPACDDIEITPDMPIELWRPNWRPLKLSAYDFVIDDDVVRDLDGEAIAHISDDDVFALHTSTKTVHRDWGLRRGWFTAGLGAVPILTFSFFIAMIGSLQL